MFRFTWISSGNFIMCWLQQRLLFRRPAKKKNLIFKPTGLMQYTTKALDKIDRRWLDGKILFVGSSEIWDTTRSRLIAFQLSSSKNYFMAIGLVIFAMFRIDWNSLCPSSIVACIKNFYVKTPSRKNSISRLTGLVLYTTKVLD